MYKKVIVSEIGPDTSPETIKTLETLTGNSKGISCLGETEYVLIASRETAAACEVCGHECPCIVYHLCADANITVMSRTSCDCGHTHIYNIGGRMFRREPSRKPYTWDSDTGTGFVYITEGHAGMIIETGLITMQEGETDG